MSGLLVFARVFLFAFVVHGPVVLGTVYLSVPQPPPTHLHTDTLLLDCTFWTTLPSETVTRVTWARKGEYDRNFKVIVEIPIPLTEDKKPLYRDSSLTRRSNLTVSTAADGNTTVSLRLTPSCYDRGLFRCGVMVQGVSAPPSAQINVTLLEKPEVYSLTQAGEFKCSAALGNPPGTLAWVMVRREGNQLRNITMGGMASQKINPQYCYPGIESVLRTDVTGDDEKILCVVTSGETSASRELSISVPYAVRNIRIVINVDGRQMGYWVKEVSAFQGDTVVLNCSARGRPSPGYKLRHWSESENTWTPVNTSGRPVLTLTEVSHAQQGKYSCIAENNVRGATHSVSEEIYISIKERLTDGTDLTPQRKASPHTILLIIIFVGIVVVVMTVGLCVLIYCTVIRRRAKRRRRPINSIELEYQPVVRRPSRRFSSDPVPPRARDDFRI